MNLLVLSPSLPRLRPFGLAGRARAPRRHAGLSRGTVRSERAAGAAGMNAMIDAPALPLDRLGRPLRDLRLSVIEACNFRCGYCMPADKVPDDYGMDAASSLSFDEIDPPVRGFARDRTDGGWGTRGAVRVRR